MVVRVIFVSCSLTKDPYENSNVYNLITPRKPLQFETFHELKSENFSIFSPIADILVANFYTRRITNIVLITNLGVGSTLVFGGSSNYHVNVVTELGSYSESMFKTNMTSELMSSISLNPMLGKWVAGIYKSIGSSIYYTLTKLYT